MQHTVSAYDEELNALRSIVTQMGGLAEQELAELSPPLPPGIRKPLPRSLPWINGLMLWNSRPMPLSFR
ncbi:hypothetical protein JCM17846_27550 [Iodidimonas nitroreducens]|uniref:PhoU domain-containing protein n=1 Tax=Iodidimonas nitroreducens TaxID=1236968 RepID=A0A5A7N9P0_9PROT|nr:hypothetical protein JCM17846_27550 [Iodidimonas nitroreducens]